MQAAGAAEGEQGELAGVLAALHRDHPQRPGHGRLGHLQHALGQPLRRQSGAGGERFHRRPAGRHVEGHAAAEEAIGEEPAEIEVGVGDGHLAPAATIADRTGIGPGALRADAQRAAGVEAGDGTAAGADGVQVDHRHPYRPAGDDRLAAGGDRPRTEADVGGGAAHVEGQDPLMAGGPGGGEGADHTAGGAGEDGAHRLAGGGFRADRAAVALHDAQPRGAQARLQPPQVAGHHRRHGWH